MNMDPKVAIWLNIAFAVLTGLSAPALQAAGIVDASQVVAVAALVAMPLNIILHAYSSSTPGPLASPDKPQPPAPPIAAKRSTTAPESSVDGPSAESVGKKSEPLASL